ncbi:unnamed protein product [Polarella glacialis]|uniref:Uncharacterized protein n=1 Tax=Polarella glacialis TaxID=89957 RepID=A0A813FM76_POLGL|nr:unnamed protein product [Polarella glacialis]
MALVVGGAAAAVLPDDFSLDLVEPQVLIEFPLDPDGFFWHHRILLKRIAGPTWLALTPDHNICRRNLETSHHMVLERASQFPAAQRPFVYAFDPIDRATLEGFKRIASTQAALLGDAGDVEVQAYLWVVCDFTRPDYGNAVDYRLVNDALTGVAFESKGIVKMGNEEVFVEKVQADKLAAWAAKAFKDASYTRLLGDHRDAAGKRKLDLSSAVAMMRETKMDDFPLQGVRACREYLSAISEGPGNINSYHAEWVRLSGVNEASAVCHSHRTLSETMRLLIIFDQVDLSNMAGGEQLIRWIIQIETAVERNPKLPDFSGLDIVTGATASSEGKALAPKFGEWITERMKSRATIWKSQRLYNEERRGTGGYKGDSKGSKDKGGEYLEATSMPAKFSSPAFGVPARDRRHGDPFPLPVPSPQSAPSRAASTSQRQVFEALQSLNALAGPTRKSACAQKHSSPPSASLKPTSVQQWMMDDVAERISRHGDQPADLSEESSLGELLASSGPYSGNVGHLASFDIKKIKVLSRHLRPQEAASLCPPWTALHRVGFLTFRRRAKAKVGAYLDLDLGDYAASGFGPIYEPSGDEGDVGDCFYNFLQDDERLCPAFLGVCMGWSWALHMAQEIVSHQVSHSENYDKSDQIRDKQLAPLLQPGRPVLGIYVDNVAIIGGVPEDADKLMRAVSARFEDLGIPFVVTHGRSQAFLDAIGLRFDFARRALMHKSRRCLATLALLRRRKVRGSVLQVWGGRVIHHFSLLRPGMSCLHSFYRFIEFAGNEQKVLWPSVRQEMRLVIGLVFLGEAHLGAPLHRDVYLGDSSTYGFSLMVTKSTPQEVRQATLHRERWRFIAPDEELGAPLVSPLDHSSFGGLSPLGGHEIAPPPGLDGHHLGDFRPRGSCPDAGVRPRTKYGQQLLQQAERRSKPVQSFRPLRPPRPLVDVPNIIPEMRVLLMGVRRCCRDRLALGHKVESASGKGTLAQNGMWLMPLQGGSIHLVPSIPSEFQAHPAQWGRQQGVLSAGSEEGNREPLLPAEPARAPAEEKQFQSSRRRARQMGHTMSLLYLTLPFNRNQLLPKPFLPDRRQPRYFLELFSGSGILTTAFRQACCNVLPACEILNGVFDLTRRSTQEALLRFLRTGMVWYIHMGTPCAVWSRARHGLTNMVRARARELVSVELALFAVAVARLASSLGIWWSIENPRSSRLWNFHPVSQSLQLPHTQWFDWDMCQYNSPHKKPTAIVPLSPDWLELVRVGTSTMCFVAQNESVFPIRDSQHDSECRSLPCAPLSSLVQASHLPLSSGSLWGQQFGIHRRIRVGSHPCHSPRAPLSMALLCNMGKRRTEQTSTSLGTPATGPSTTMSPSSSVNAPMPKRRAYGSSGLSGLASSNKRGRVLCAKTSTGVLLPNAKQLKCRKVTSNTLARYHTALQEFDTWAKKNKLGLKPHERLDASMVEFMRQQYEAGSQSWEGSYLVYGFHVAAELLLLKIQ